MWRLNKKKTLLTSLFISSFIFDCECLSSPEPRSCVVVKVCQNKDCLKRFSASSGEGGLIQTFRDLIPNGENNLFSIEPSGCLSQCGKGPNISIQNPGDDTEKVYSNVDDVQMTSAVLDVGAGLDTPITLMAAVEVMGKASTITNPQKKLKLLTSVVKALTKDGDAQLIGSTAIAHALVLRADTYLEMNPPNINMAMDDVNKAIGIDPIQGRAWRIKADLEEITGNYSAAIDALVSWSRANPDILTKANREINRLRTYPSSSVPS